LYSTFFIIQSFGLIVRETIKKQKQNKITIEKTKPK